MYMFRECGLYNGVALIEDAPLAKDPTTFLPCDEVKVPHVTWGRARLLLGRAWTFADTFL